MVVAQNPTPTVSAMNIPADLILINGRITTLDPAQTGPEVAASRG